MCTGQGHQTLPQVNERAVQRWLLLRTMKLSESCTVACALVASLGSAGAAKADDFKTVSARADIAGPMRGTTLPRGSSTIKELKWVAPDKLAKKEMQFNSFAHSDAGRTAVLNSAGDLARAFVSPSIRAPGVRPAAVARRGRTGHDFRSGSVIVGVELDVETIKLYDGKSTTTTYSCCTVTSLVDPAVKTDWLFTGRPRFGVVSGHYLVYGTGGMALTNCICEAAATEAVAKAYGNWTAGGGVEYMSARLVLRGEYLYYPGFAGMATAGVSMSPSPPASVSSLVTQTANRKPQIVRAALSFRF